MGLWSKLVALAGAGIGTFVLPGVGTKLGATLGGGLGTLAEDDPSPENFLLGAGKGFATGATAQGLHSLGGQFASQGGVTAEGVAKAGADPAIDAAIGGAGDAGVAYASNQPTLMRATTPVQAAQEIPSVPASQPMQTAYPPPQNLVQQMVRAPQGIQQAMLPGLAEGGARPPTNWQQSRGEWMRGEGDSGLGLPGAGAEGLTALEQAFLITQGLGTVGNLVGDITAGRRHRSQAEAGGRIMGRELNRSRAPRNLVRRG